MNPEPPNPSSGDFLTFGVLTEVGIGLVAFWLGAVFGGVPRLSWSAETYTLVDAGWQFLIGLAATVPLLAMYFVLERIPSRALSDIRNTLETQLLPRLRGTSLSGLAALALAAGFGEELLFRGWLQPRVTEWVGSPNGVFWGIAAGSLAFGLCHWMNWAYGVLAAVVGIYLGVLAEWTNGLVAPSVAHAAYDLVVLKIMVTKTPPAETDTKTDNLDEQA
jgi:membrane protease YdiL (CAAX protease family)